MKDNEPTVEKMNKILKESMDTTKNKTQKFMIKKSTEDIKSESVLYLTNVFNNILKTKQIPDSWHEAKIVVCLKPETPKTFRTTGLKPLVTQLYNIYKTLAN